MKLKKRKYAVGQVIGAGMQIGNMIGDPIRRKAEETDPYSGAYTDFNAATRNAQAGSFWAPWKAATAEGATTGEKILGALGWGAATQRNRLRRVEKEHMDEAWLARNPNVMGQSYNPYYMAKGGMVGGEYAELEDGEPFMTPDGNIEMVNGRTHSQGGEDFMLPEGTAILGKNYSKIYGEKFKELGAKLKRAQDKHEKILDSKSTPIARRSSLLMLDQIDKEYNDLIMEQEMEKESHMMPNGSMMEDGNMEYATGGIHIKKKNRGKFTAYKKRTGKTTEEALHSKDPRVRKMAQFAKNARKWKHPYGDVTGMTGLTEVFPYSPVEYVDNEFALERENYLNSLGGQEQPVFPTASRIDRMPSLAPMQPRGGVFAQPDTSSLGSKGNQLLAETTGKGSNYLTPEGGSGFGSTMNTIGQLAPIIYNLGQGMFGQSDKYNYQRYTNPYIGDIRSKMRNRRFDVNPILESNKISQAVYNRNLRSAGASPAQLLAGLQSGVNARQRADASAYSQRSNINNQYIGEQAEMDYNIGKDISGLKQYGYEANLRNRAAKRNYLSTGLSQLQQYSQLQELIKNQKLSDKEKIRLLEDILPNYFYDRQQGYGFKTSNK